MKQFFCKTKNGHSVYYDSETSHASTHFKVHPNLQEITKKILENYEAKTDRIRFAIDTGKEVGMTDLVETGDGDDIIYAKRPLRDVYNRFVKNKSASPTSFVTIDLRKTDNESYDLMSAYIGDLTPPTPGKDDETSESKPFWNTHALVWGNQDIEPGTETTVCPWE